MCKTLHFVLSCMNKRHPPFNVWVGPFDPKRTRPVNRAPKKTSPFRGGERGGVGGVMLARGDVISLFAVRDSQQSGSIREECSLTVV